MFKKVLIANRGEIAVRIIRACRDLGIQSVGLFEPSDQGSLHVRFADEVVRLDSSHGYMDHQVVLQAAKDTGADAIHPGYGFLAEDPAFVEACEEAGIVFIGPPSSVVSALRDNLGARERVAAAGCLVRRCVAGDTGDAAGRADVLAARAQAAAAANMAKVARGAMLPHLNLQAEKNWFHRDELFGDEADSWTFGVYATWDVFSGLEDVGALRKARAQSRAAAHLADSAQRQAGLELDQARREAAAAAEKLDVAADAVVSARESLRIVDEMYREGLASMVDLLDVQAMATQAEGALVQARHDLRVSEAGMIYAGAIDPAAGREDRE